MAQPALSALRNQYVSYINNQWDNVDPNRTVHLITWNPKPRFYAYDKYGENDYDSQWHSMLHELMKSFRCCDNYAFVAEISEEGKLHMHGFYQVYDKIKYHKSFLPSLRKNGFIKHNKARSLDRKVIKYHKKDIYDTIEHMKDQSVPTVLCPETRDELSKLFYLRIINIAKKEISNANLMKWLPTVATENDWTEI